MNIAVKSGYWLTQNRSPKCNIPSSAAGGGDGDAYNHSPARTRFPVLAHYFYWLWAIRAYHVSSELSNSETEKSLRKIKSTRKISSDSLQGLSSDELRASKTFAAFRDYVRQFMFWVAVDDDDPAEVAAYERFLLRNAPNLSKEMSDEDIEFLFRHVTPEPETHVASRTANERISMHYLTPSLSITANSPRNAAAPQPASLDSGLYITSAALIHFASFFPLFTDVFFSEGRAQAPGPRRRRRLRRYAQPQTYPRPRADGEVRVNANLLRLPDTSRPRRRAAIKALPLQVQQELAERARASRARYREQHRMLLLQKERARRQQQSPYSVEEYFQLRRVRESRPSHRNYLRPVQPYHPDSASLPPAPIFF
ncbi:hypothetical protein DFH06DRAFT_1318534 [Mycena polygramma]|nr:hypothetical protein DFH06DRAFT_1318534 [Mycena polygramma]